MQKTVTLTDSLNNYNYLLIYAYTNGQTATHFVPTWRLTRQASVGYAGYWFLYVSRNSNANQLVLDYSTKTIEDYIIIGVNL